MAYIKDTNDQFLQHNLPIGWPWRLLLSMGIVLIVVLLVYFGLAFGYEGFLNNSISTLNTNLNSLSLEVSPTDRANFVSFYSQITNLQNLLASHVVSSGVFPVFENMTDQSVTYSSFGLSVKDKTVTIDGVAKDYKTLADQLALYKQSPDVSDVVLEGSSFSNNQVRFTVKLTLNDNAGLNL